MSSFPISIIFYDATLTSIWQEDAADAFSLRYSYKLPGGDAAAEFSLDATPGRLARWLSSSPAVVEMLLIDSAGPDWPLWRGRLVPGGVLYSPDQHAITVRWVGYWMMTAAQTFTHTFPGGTPTTLRNLARWCLGLDSGTNCLPFLSTSDVSGIGDPLADVSPVGHDFEVDHRYPRDIFQQVLQAGSNTGQQWLMAVWADRVLRLFARNTLITWQIWRDEMLGEQSLQLSWANTFSKVWVPWTRALADPVTCADGTTVTGSQTLVTSTGIFTADQIGQRIDVSGAGPSGATLVTTIAAYYSATSVALGAGASTDVDGTATVTVQPSDGAVRWSSAENFAIQTAIGGYRREVLLGNPATTKPVADAIALQWLKDHAGPTEEGAGFGVRSELHNVYGSLIPAYRVRPNELIQIVDFSQAALNLTGAADNQGIYWISEVGVDVDSATVSIKPENPNPDLFSVSISSGM
jgi:hypothetical protein